MSQQQTSLSHGSASRSASSNKRPGDSIHDSPGKRPQRDHPANSPKKKNAPKDGEATRSPEDQYAGAIQTALELLAPARLLERVLQAPIAAQRSALGDLLIAAPASSLTPQVLDLVDTVYLTENVAGAALELDDVKRQCFLLTGGDHHVGQLGVWRGDITTLHLDGIVNAANETGLGCFVPSHRCVDNVIHRAAGPNLRVFCDVVMRNRDSQLTAGTKPIITPGGHLAAKHVLHVTSPCILPAGRSPTANETEQLRSCYRGVLDLAKANGLRSVAFCCLGTGLFNFPSALAAEIALEEGRVWQANHAGAMDLVLFDVFTDADEDAYRKAAVRKNLGSCTRLFLCSTVVVFSHIKSSTPLPFCHHDPILSRTAV